MMRRQNMTTVVNRKRLTSAVKELDAFPKIPESYTESTVSGGGISIVAVVCIVILTVSEIMYYTATEIKYSYNVDDKPDNKLKINVDITVAMKCHMIGADVLDVTGQNAAGFGELQKEAVHFEMDSQQKAFHELATRLNTYLRDEYHSMHEVLWLQQFSGKFFEMPSRSQPVEGDPDGCRLHGTLEVNKVAGNFHITAGQTLPNFFLGHSHLTMNLAVSDYNFSHRIDSFSFGETVMGRVNPLDSDLRITDQHYHMYQYFVQVVPTTVETSSANMDTYQYSVTERNRAIDHGSGSHGVPGIYVKYDISSLKVTVKEQHKPYWKFLVRLCGIIGGIFTTSGMLSQVIGVVIDVLCCRYKVGKYQEAPTKLDSPVGPGIDLTVSVPGTVGQSLNIVPQSTPSVSNVVGLDPQDYDHTQELGSS